MKRYERKKGFSFTNTAGIQDLGSIESVLFPEKAPRTRRRKDWVLWYKNSAPRRWGWLYLRDWSAWGRYRSESDAKSALASLRQRGGYPVDGSVFLIRGPMDSRPS